MVIREIPSPVSPTSKKRMERDMVRCIQKKKKLIEDPLDEVVVEIDFENSGKSQSPTHHDDMGIPSPSMNSPLNSIFEETGGSGGNVEEFYVDTTTNRGDPSQVSAPKQTTVTPSGVSTVESVSEEVRTSGINANISDMNANVNKGDGVFNNIAQGTSTIIISSTLDTLTIDTITSIPPFHTPISPTLPQSTTSPTFHNILNQPITSLIQSQSMEGPKSVTEDDTTEGDDDMVSFANIQFDPE